MSRVVILGKLFVDGVLQFESKMTHFSRHTRLFIPNDEIRKKMEKYLEGFDGSKHSMVRKHKDFHSELNKTKVSSTLSEELCHESI